MPPEKNNYNIKYIDGKKSDIFSLGICMILMA